MKYGVEYVPWGQYGSTHFYTPAPQTYKDVALTMGLEPSLLQSGLQGMYDPNSSLYSGMENSINAYYDRAQNDYMKYINNMMDSMMSNTGSGSMPTTVADVLRSHGNGSLESGAAREITDLAALEAAKAGEVFDNAISSFIPSQKAALRSKAGAVRSLSQPDWYDQSLMAAWALPRANASSSQFANSSNTSRQQIANVAQGNNDMLRYLMQMRLNNATTLGANVANFGLERARALTAANNSRLGYLANVGQGLLQGALYPRTTQIQSFGPAGTSMLGTMTNATGGFRMGGSPGPGPVPQPQDPYTPPGGGGAFGDSNYYAGANTAANGLQAGIEAAINSGAFGGGNNQRGANTAR